jgi:hypothetical protein
MKNGLLVLLTGFFLLDIAGGGRSGGGCNRVHGGRVSGTVQFHGLNCQPGQPDFNVPPCTGPYPNYKVEIYKGDGKTLATTAMTDPQGSYRIDLPDGEYVIYTQSGPMESNRKEHRFNVQGGHILNLNLDVSTGIL